MRKIAIVLGVLGMCSLSHADGLSDQINATLLGHVETITEFTTKGRTQLELLDTVFQIGKFGNNYLGAVDGGFLGDTAPVAAQRIDYTVGIKFHLAPILRKYIVFNPEWTFLNSVELNPRYSYNFTEHHGVMGLAVGLAFGLSPLK